MQTISQELIDNFWESHERFLKGTLTTETPNVETIKLSKLCQSDLASAFNLFKKVEMSAVKSLIQYSAGVKELQRSIQTCIMSSGKVYIIGCGASARLAVLLRRLWEYYNHNSAGIVVSVSSAGDTSLIRSVEQFEDSAEFGVKQLQQQNFNKNDLLIGLSASGESPFILAAIEYASVHSKHNPWLVCNNSIQDILIRNPKNVISNNKVKSLALNVGEMAVTGSTRLQATTSMQLAVGFALCINNIEFETYINNMGSVLDCLELTELSYITKYESEIIANNEYILYQTNNNLLGLSMLADITERAPTFNIIQFENYSDNLAPLIHSPFYLSLTHANSINEAWQYLLGQDPICLNWRNLKQTSTHYMNGFDLSNNSPRIKATNLPNTQHNESWKIENNTLGINLLNYKCEFNIPQDYLSATIVYKLLLNSHSTLMFGRLGYYSGNLMHSLTPSNYKLIDRAIRYCIFLLAHEHNIVNLKYNNVANILFAEITKLQPNQSIVLNVVNRIVKSI